MRAGAYDEIVDIYKVVVTRNEYGEQHDDYEYSCTTRANVVQTGGTRSVQPRERMSFRRAVHAPYRMTRYFTLTTALSSCTTTSRLTSLTISSGGGISTASSQ